MKGKTKKYVSDFAVNLYSARWLMISASELLSGKDFPQGQKEALEVVNRSHIYIITKIPKFYYIKDSISYKDGLLTAIVGYKHNGKEKFIKGEDKIPSEYGITKVKISNYPHRNIIACNSNDEEVFDFPASLIGINSGKYQNNQEISNLEVLYVGQSYGDGNRNTFDRLRKHETLQKILADCSYNYPDDEVYLLSFEYMPYRIVTMMDGKAKVETTAEDDSQRFYSILENPLSEHQQICLIEAGLIKYFKPKYNKIYKEKFPSSSHKILEECYKLDFSGLVVEINTEELNFFLYSDSVGKNFHHIIKIDLIDFTDRYGFFHFTLDKNMKTVYSPPDLTK